MPDVRSYPSAAATRRATPSPQRLTYRDLLRTPEDGKRREIVNGVPWVTPSPNTRHQVVLGNMYYLMREHVERQGAGIVFVSPFDVVLSMFDVVVPDLIYLTPESVGRLTRRHLRGAPDLTVEIASPGTRRRDDGLKLKLYERFEVKEYWIVEPVDEVIRVYRRRTSRLASAGTLCRASGHVLVSPLIEGLQLPLDRIFARPV